MVRSNSDRFGGAGAFCCAALMAGILACAGAAVRDEPTASAGAERIQDLLVETSGATTRVTLLGPDSIIKMMRDYSGFASAPVRV